MPIIPDPAQHRAHRPPITRPFTTRSGITGPVGAVGWSGRDDAELDLLALAIVADVLVDRRRAGRA